MKTQTAEQIILAVLSNVDQRAANTARAALDALLEQHRKEIEALRSQDNERIDADAARVASLGESLLYWGTRARNAETNLATIREVAESALNGVAQQGPIQVHGQVAEDEKELRWTIERAPMDPGAVAEDLVRLERLAAQAQGFEAAESRLAAVRERVESLRMSMDSGDLGMSEDAASELYGHLEDLESVLKGDAPTGDTTT